ncbi:hypothetical protein KG089_04245 [Carnobacteriaceae bacterium zg-ZUI252]|nr:hypothetical protein [Carnobacteriaceae bacterium zg-ZUI252]QTU83153.1 hypothetical protein J7S27_01105 [Carnobacteriaceae bacterium zg-C25]
MDKKKLGTIGVIILAIIGVGLRFLRFNDRIEKRERERESYSQLVQVRSAVQNMSSTTKYDFKKLSAKWSSMSNHSTKENAGNLSYDKYTPVDGTYSLGQIQSKYYVVDVKSGGGTPMDNVTEAYVVFLRNNDANWESNIIVGKVKNEWLVFGPEANVHGNLGDIEITSKTKRLTLQNDKITFE